MSHWSKPESLDMKSVWSRGVTIDQSLSRRSLRARETKGFGLFWIKFLASFARFVWAIPLAN